MAVGPGARDKEGKTIPVPFKEGDTVLLPEFGGSQVKLGEKEYVHQTLFQVFFLIIFCLFGLVNRTVFFFLVGFVFSFAGFTCIEMRIFWALCMSDRFHIPMSFFSVLGGLAG